MAATRKKAAERRVFESENEFWNADEKLRRGCQPFVIIDRKTHKTYYVWSQAKVTAEGLVAQYLDLFNVSAASREPTMFENDTDALFAAVKRMPNEVRAKLIKLAQLECPYCDEKCNSQAGLTLHLKAKHPAEYEQLQEEEEDGN